MNKLSAYIVVFLLGGAAGAHIGYELRSPVAVIVAPEPAADQDSEDDYPDEFLEGVVEA